MEFLLFFFVTLTTVVAEADERFGKAYLRWARPVAISEIKPDLREIREDFFREITKLQIVFIAQLDQRHGQRFLRLEKNWQRPIAIILMNRLFIISIMKFG